MGERRPVQGNFGWTFEETRRRQMRAGLAMTPAERLAWLESMLDELLPLVGRGRLREEKSNRTHD
jgi:hypothetical protein